MHVDLQILARIWLVSGMGMENEWGLAVGVYMGMGMMWEETWELKGKWEYWNWNGNLEPISTDL